MSNIADKNTIAVEHVKNFQLDGETILCRPFGKGHINETYLIVDDTARSYILQKINKNVFRDPLTVMKNIVAIIGHFTKQFMNAEGTPRGLLELVPSRGGELWHVDESGDFWRVYTFIADTVCYQWTDSSELFKESGAAFGAFQRSLADFPAGSLGVTIPDFHNTPKRYEAYHAAVHADIFGRLKDARREADFVLSREPRAGVLMDRHAEGALPLRVTHNDTKLNNVLFDRRNKKSICVIDLDTVMPGFSVTDFGDAIRFGASTADEDEKDLSKVSFSLRMFEAFAEGYISACGDNITGDEIESLCDGAYVITLECGMRFLTDYLSGDTYYRTAYPGHNLDRCRTQFKLVADMEAAWDNMQSVINRIKT